MDVYFEESFEEDLKKIKDMKVLQKVKSIIDEVRNIANIHEVANLKKLKGYETFYRTRFRDYRIGIEAIETKVIFTRCLHRKDIYKHFSKE